MVVNRINNMRQYFYLIGHDIVGDDFVADKIFLQEHDALRWGRRLATQHTNYNVMLYKQQIARTATIQFVKHINPYLEEADAIRLASKHHLEAEVQSAMDSGMTPLEACREWDVL